MLERRQPEVNSASRSFKDVSGSVQMTRDQGLILQHDLPTHPKLGNSECVRVLRFSKSNCVCRHITLFTFLQLQRISIMPAPSLPVAPVTSEDPVKKKKDEEKESANGKGKEDASKAKGDKEEEGDELVWSSELCFD